MFGRKKKQMTQADAEAYVKAKQKHMVDLVKSTFESAGWEYTFKPDQNVIVSGFMEDDLPIHLAIAVREMSLHFLCNLDFIAEPE